MLCIISENPIQEIAEDWRLYIYLHILLVSYLNCKNVLHYQCTSTRCANFGRGKESGLQRGTQTPTRKKADIEHNLLHRIQAAAFYRGTRLCKDLNTCSFWQFLLRFRLTNHPLRARGMIQHHHNRVGTWWLSGQQVSIGGQVASCPSCA